MVRRHYPVVIAAGGVVLIGMGVLIWTGEFTQLNITVNHWLQHARTAGLQLRHLSSEGRPAHRPGQEGRPARAGMYGPW